MMRNPLLLFLLGFGFTGIAGAAGPLTPVPKTMKQLNVKCTAPKLCRKLERTRDVCLLNAQMCEEFVSVFAQLLPEYDCSNNKMSDANKVLIPAIWMCENVQSGATFTALSNVKSLSGQRLYASPAFRWALNGPAGMSHYGPSLEREKQLRAAGALN